MTRKLWGIIILAVAMLAWTELAKADSIGPNCGTCFGSVYTLEYLPDPISTTATTETFRVTYTLDSTGYSGIGTFINAVGIKVASAADTVGASLFSAPGGVGNWSVGLGSLNANGCNFAAGADFACAEDVIAGTGGHAAVGGVLVWVFDVEVDTGSLFTGLNAASIKALYVKDNGKQAGITSENITLQEIPEPGTLMLFGTGLLSLAGVIRRRLSA